MLGVEAWVVAWVVALALFASSAPMSAQYRGFGQNKVQYKDFDWKIYHSTHFDVHYYEEEKALLQKVVSFAESAYDQLAREFNYHQITEPTPLIFYATHSAFEQNNIILNFIPEGIGAFASPARNRIVLPVDMPDPDLMKLLLHEMTHIFQYHILFQGRLGRAATLRPPQWFMEGMASYMADDEGSHDKMVLRDAVVNDNIPSVTEGNFGGYFAYRLGHAVFDYIEERWGKEGFRDFVFEFRNTLGSRPGRAIQQAFRIDPEDFDLEFRRWLRKKYLRSLVDTGEPSDFGRPFRVDHVARNQETSPVASPSGDLLAAISVQRGEVDIVLFDTRTRRQIRNLTKGLAKEYRYLVAQGFLVPRRMGRDLTFSPDGNQIAVFARRDEGRAILFIDVLNGGIQRILPMDIEQQVAPAWSPDGRYIAFAGNRDGQFDLFMIDLSTEEVIQVTDDPVFDGAPAFSPDGRSLIFTSVVGEYAKLFRIDVDDPTQRYQLTRDDSNDKDAIYSPDGRRVYFTSDRNGFDNIYSLDLESGELKRWTDVVTGCFMPAVLARRTGGEDLAFTGLWNGTYSLFLNDLEEPVEEPITIELALEPTEAADLPLFEPDIEVTVDEANEDNYGGWKLFLEDAQTAIAVDNNNTFLGQVRLSFTDYLGDKRVVTTFSSFDSLSNFNVLYADLSDRLQWNVNLFDSRNFFFVQRDPNSGTVLDRRFEVRISGLIGSLSYPLSFNSRASVGVGYIFRKLDRQQLLFDPEFGQFLAIVEDKDDFPWFEASLVNDSAVYQPWGPASGRRMRVDVNYAPNIDKLDGEESTLTSEFSADYRQYFSLSRRTVFAMRAFVGTRQGEDNVPFFVGGDNIRGFDYRRVTGENIFFTNFELRFPLIDLIATPVFNFQGVRGRFFLDIAGVWDDGQSFQFWNSEESRLEDGISTYGFGVTVRFLGLDLNWDLAKQWNFDQTTSDTRTTFYIGQQF